MMRITVWLLLNLLCFNGMAQQNQMDFPPIKRQRVIQDIVINFCQDKQDGAYHFTKQIDVFNVSTSDSVNCQCVSNKAHGPWQLYVNKVHVLNGYYQEGKEDGEWNFFHANGKVEIKASMKNGVMHGPTKFWYANGKKYIEKNYVNGLLEGQVVTFFEDGTEWINVSYNNGLYNGKFVQWMDKGFDKVHHMYLDLTFQKGVLDGKQVYYHVNGKKHMEVLYDHDKVVSGKSWNDKGVEISYDHSDEPTPRYDKFF